MKTITTLSIIAVLYFFGFHPANAQQFKASTYSEITRVSPKAGVSVGAILPIERGNIELGGFYQKSLAVQAGEGAYAAYEKKFYGFYTSFFLIEKERFELKLNVRAGSVNKKYFAITPALKSEVKLGKNISLETGVGMRAFRPTLITGLAVKF